MGTRIIQIVRILTNDKKPAPYNVSNWFSN